MRKLITAKGIWNSRSALHCGGAADQALSGFDMVLARDHEERPFIPAASLIGAGRSYAGKYLMSAAEYEASDEGDREPYREPQRLLYLFGSRARYASFLSAGDATLMDNTVSALRDGVRIDSRNGLAFANSEGGAKYDCEVLPAGSRFRLEFGLRLPDQLPNNVTEAEMLSAFGVVLQGFLSGEIRLGARTSRGYGAGAVENWAIRRIDSPGRYVAWLRRDQNAGEALALTDLVPDAVDHRRRFEIEASFRLKTSLLVRSAGNRANEPDAVHLTEGGSPILPGTSIAGVMRHRCERIANTVCPSRASELVNGMFGPLKSEGVRTALRASRVRVEETFLGDGSRHVHTRVAIDRFTQGALESALFDEAPFWPNDSKEGHLRNLRLTLNCSADEAGFAQEAGLLLMAFKDLWLGDLTVGGGAGSGRGVLEGLRAVFRHPDLEGEIKMQAQGTGRGTILKSGPEAGWRKLEEWAKSLAENCAA